jgi:hypothetical protein
MAPYKNNIIFADMDPVVYSASNGNEYQRQKKKK